MYRHDSEPISETRDQSRTQSRSRIADADWSRRLSRAVVAALAIGIVLGLGVVAPVSGAGSTAGVASSGIATAEASTSASVAADEPELVVSNGTIAPGDTGTHRIALTDAPDGLAGYKLELEFSSEGAARVANASYPERFGLTTDPIVSADGQSLAVEAADLDDEIAAGATNVTLARIEVDGVEAGTTDLQVAAMQVDADGGSPVEPAVEAGTVTVGDGGTEAGHNRSADGDAESDGSGTDSGLLTDTPAESLPGFTGTLALVAVVAAIAVGTAARRD
ncbi:hypothetical protein [Natrialba taiwanensis]|uniref:Cell surface protein n=1 Tax=Natrialba taiwanensis DSM 12281 TaxID=1230458 RepID=L9ZV35_9EURY|nr:hypothetical protein [Natrialba taiwanensis]ELY89946.1 hypothetical protein C484_13126 [Natrialba taiwanensis DSM 12281]